MTNFAEQTYECLFCGKTIEHAYYKAFTDTEKNGCIVNTKHVFIAKHKKE